MIMKDKSQFCEFDVNFQHYIHNDCFEVFSLRKRLFVHRTAVSDIFSMQGPTHEIVSPQCIKRHDYEGQEPILSL